MTMRIAHIWHDCRPPLQQRQALKQNIDAIREAITRKWWGKDDKSPSLPSTRRSRLSSEQRAEMLAELEKGYERLHANPEELADEIAEGRYWDAALTDPIIDE